ncbi:hypothetical protein BASA81_003764 [Batrachochytrium salamandrivorans]|nr:hypothetical protein BASA81_003764 [Batrachochytrium salamandrivorans]
MDAWLLDLEQRTRRLEIELMLREVDVELRRNVSNSFLRAKVLVSALSSQDLEFALARVRQIKSSLYAWEKTASLLFSSCKGGVLMPQLGELILEVISTVRKTYHVDEARFAKKLLECLPQPELGLEFANWLVTEAKNFHLHLPLRAIGLDVLGMYADGLAQEQVLHLVNFALKCGTANNMLSKTIEDAVRRLCDGGRHATAVGIVLVECLSKTRGVVSAYKLSQKLGLGEHFPALTQTARREQVLAMIALGPNKAFGWATLKPDRRVLVVAMLIQHGHHLTAQRLAQQGDLLQVQREHGVELDLQACLYEAELRKQTYLQLDSNQVAVHFIDTIDKFVRATPCLVSGDGVLTLDAEWLPCLDSKSPCPVQLLQFARGKHDVFVIDVVGLGFQPEFHELMHSFLLVQREIWGFGLEMDCKMIQQTFPTQPWPGLIKPRVRNIPTPNKNTGLSAMCLLVLGKALDKEQQMSVWSRRPLLREQLEYAALDAHVLALLHDRLDECGRHPIPVPVVPTPLPPQPVGPQRFFCDEMLLRVAKMLRAVNIDCAFESSSVLVKRRDALQPRLARARAEGRVFITADLNLSQEPNVFCVTHQGNEERFREICSKFALPLDRNTILLRCTMCNGPEFTVVSKNLAREINPIVVTEMVYLDERITEYYACAQCNSVVWQGPKYKQVQTRMSRLIGDDGTEESNNLAGQIIT